MSHDTLEQAVLSGALFRDPSAVMSEFREEDRSTPSPEPNTDDELGSDYSPPSSPRPSPGTGVENSRSTGVKGVIKDSKQAALRARETQLARRLLANQALEERALLAPTWDEDEELRAGEDGDVAEVARRWAKQPSSAGPGGDQRERARGGEGAGAGGPRKGYLREVSMQGYLNAVDHAEGWVVILVFEPDIQNLAPETLLALQALASSHPPPAHTFLLARSSTLSFLLRPDGQPDHDVLPSLLVYAPGGELRETFIRVDLELQKRKGGVASLLRRHKILPRRRTDDDADVSASDSDDGFDD